MFSFIFVPFLFFSLSFLLFLSPSLSSSPSLSLLPSLPPPLSPSLSSSPSRSLLPSLPLSLPPSLPPSLSLSLPLFLPLSLPPSLLPSLPPLTPSPSLSHSLFIQCVGFPGNQVINNIDITDSHHIVHSGLFTCDGLPCHLSLLSDGIILINTLPGLKSMIKYQSNYLHSSRYNYHNHCVITAVQTCTCMSTSILFIL